MFRSGTFVANHVEPVTADQIQPNGVDLTLDAIFEPIEAGAITRDGKAIAERREVVPGTNDLYTLSAGGYIARYGEIVEIPDDHIGFIYPRSSLLRNGGMINTAVWDAGYTGRGEGLIQIHHDISLQQNARVAQFVLARADHTGFYDGSYQAENLDF